MCKTVDKAPSTSLRLLGVLKLAYLAYIGIWAQAKRYVFRACQIPFSTAVARFIILT